VKNLRRRVEWEQLRSLCLYGAQKGPRKEGKIMAKFLFTYSGGNSSPDDMDAEMAAWEGWFGVLGEAIVDVGNPIAMSKVLAADGTVTEAVPESLSGYSLIEAADGHAALELAKGCPVLTAGGTVTVALTVEM
jgi:hypothetical protein